MLADVSYTEGNTYIYVSINNFLNFTVLLTYIIATKCRCWLTGEPAGFLWSRQCPALSKTQEDLFFKSFDSTTSIKYAFKISAVHMSHSLRGYVLTRCLLDLVALYL